MQQQDPSYYCSITNSSLCGGKLIPYYHHYYDPSFGGISNCTEPCNGVYFSPIQITILQYIAISTSSICFIAGLIILMIYLFNFRKIHHPEAPLYYISLVNTFISFSHLLSSGLTVVTSNGVHCDSSFTNYYNESALLQYGINNPYCVILFALYYYSLLSVWIWWTLLTLEWLICSIKTTFMRKKHIAILHAIGWSIPLLFLITVLSLGAVSGSSVERTCWISNRNDYELLLFLILPLSLCMLLNGMLLCIGFGIGCKKKKTAPQTPPSHPTTANHTTTPSIPLLARTSIFSTVYLIISGVLLVCYLYDYLYHKEWEMEYLRAIVHLIRTSCFTDSTTNHFMLYSFTIIRIVGSQVVGVVLLLWILRKELLCGRSCGEVTNLNVTITSGETTGPLSLISYTTASNASRTK